MPIEGGFVGMVDREVFDEWLRDRAAAAGRRAPHRRLRPLERDARRHALSSATARPAPTRPTSVVRVARARRDRRGRRPLRRLARQTIKGADTHAMRLRLSRDHPLAAPTARAASTAARCDVFYQGQLSPDFYAWIFPHGETASVGVGSAQKGFSLRGAVKALRASTALAGLRDRCARRARPSRCARSSAGTTAATSCWPATPRAWWRRRRARASTTPWSAAGTRRDAVEAFLHTGDAARPGLGAQALHARARHGLPGCSGSCSTSGTAATSAARGSSRCAPTPTCRRLTWQAYMNKELVRADPGRPRPHLLQGHGPPARPLGAVTRVATRRLRAVLVAAAAARGRRRDRGHADRPGALVSRAWRNRRGSRPTPAFGIIWTMIFALAAALRTPSAGAQAPSRAEPGMAARAVRAERLSEHPLEPAVLSPPPARLGADRGGRLLAVHRRSHRVPGAVFLGRRRRCWRRIWCGCRSPARLNFEVVRLNGPFS